MKAALGSCKGQTAFEFLTLFMCAVAASDGLTDTGAMVRGDNLGSLNVASKLSPTKGIMNAIARKLTWRRIVFRWQFSVQHLPAELNDEACALSRLHEVPACEFPRTSLRSARFVLPSAQNDSLWRARLVLYNYVLPYNR